MIVAQSVSGSLLGPSALQAFRADTPVGGATPDAEDQASVLSATLLRQALIPNVTPDVRRSIRERAIEIARGSLGADMLTLGCTYDEYPATSDVDVVRLLAQRTEHKGWLHLAQHLLESAAEIAVETIETGRVLADRARNSRKQGKLALSEAQTEELFRMASRAKSDELLVHAKASMAALAQTRGNLSAFAHLAEEILSIATKARLTRRAAGAHIGLGTLAGLAGDYDRSVAHLWSAFLGSPPRGELSNAALANLAQTLAVSGRLVESRKVATLLLDTSPPIQTALPTLGGYALSSARLGDAEAVHWACQHVRRLARTRHHPREVAGALIECSAALELVGKTPPAGVLRRRAVALATAYGFHDLTFREALDAAMGPLPERIAFTGAGARAEIEIAELIVSRLPTLETILA